MKGQAIVILLSLCLASAVLSGGTASCEATTQPFLKWLNTIDKSIAVTTPDTTGNWAICNEIWSTTNMVGTCCKADNLKALFQKRIDISKANWGTYMSTLHRLRNRINRVTRISSVVTNNELTTLKNNGADFSDLQVANIKALLDSATNFESDLSTFKTAAKECFRALARARASAFCHGCWSYGGSDFADNADTTKPPTLTYKSAAANKVFETCGSTWKFLFNSNTIFTLATAISIKKKGLASKPLNDYDIFIKPSATTDAVATALANCPTFKLENACTQANIDDIVSAFFSWSGVEKVAREMPDDKTVDTDTRILATTSDAGSSSTGSTGVDLSASVTMPANTDIDTSGAGNGPSSAARLLIVALSTIFALVAILN